MKSLILILLLALLFISQFNTIVSTDLWLHFNMGHYILKNFNIPSFDLTSYTFRGVQWINHEWLSQVILYPVFDTFGWMGLSILKVALISASFLIIFFLVYYRYRKILAVLFFICFAVLVFGYRSFVRPEIFSYFLLCVFLYILEKEKRLYFLPVLQIIWVNLHGYFILGPVVVFLYALGEFLSGNKGKAKNFGKVFLLASLACFINPYFYKGALYPVGMLKSVFFGKKMFMRNVHELMMPIKSGGKGFLFYWFFAISTSCTFLMNIKNVKLKHLFVFTACFIASYAAVRNIPLFVFAAALYASINMNEIKLPKNFMEERLYIAAVLMICGLIYLFVSNRYYIFTNQYGLRKTEANFSKLFIPEGACNFLEDNNIEGPIFNTFDYGHYIGYRFYPRRRVFIDARTELYGDEFYTLYKDAQNYPEQWQKLYNKYRFEIVLLRHLFSGTERIIRYLYNDEHWKLVYYDEKSCVFLSDIPRNRGVIYKFEADFKNKRLEEKEVSMNYARFFAEIGEVELAKKVYEGLLKKDPKSLAAANNLSAIYIDLGRYEDALRLISEFLEYYPNSAELYANAGTLYYRTGYKEKAFLMFQKAVKLDRYLRRAAYMLGLVALEKGDIDKAEFQFVKYIRLDPYDPEARRILGDIYKQKGLLENAEKEYNEAKALDGRAQ